MKFKIDFDFPESPQKIEPTDKIVSLGSCFSEEIGHRLENLHFSIQINPFGVIFHPLAIANLLQNAIAKDVQANLLQRVDLFFAWEAAEKIFGYSETACQNEFQLQLKTFSDNLASADWLFITFGTANGYRLKSDGKIVANCHKKPADLFQKELTSLEEMTKVWKELLADLKNRFPLLKVVFTISPVKYLRDGIIENVRSKARLVELIQQLDGIYFPAYEIVSEELRDYRIYKSDLAHPNELATEYVYERFCATFFAEKTKIFAQDMAQFNRVQNHKIAFENSISAKKLRENIEHQKEELQKKYPFLAL